MIDAERFSALGASPLRLLDLAVPTSAASAIVLREMAQAVIIGLDRDGALPVVDPECFDALLTTAKCPPPPWVFVAPSPWSARVATISANVLHTPVAATTAYVLRLAARVSFAELVNIESLAYSTLLGGAEFCRWRAAHAPRTEAAPPRSLVAVDRREDQVRIRLTDPARRNAFCASMRDALFDALAAAIDDPTQPSVRLEGTGDCFSVGGDLNEFGTATDLATAHIVRTLRSNALMLDRLGSRAMVVLHGACIGSEIEISAAAHRRIARPSAFFQRPELSIGLMPGAGGSASLSRAIGRHRTAYMLLSGKRIDTATALTWGPVHALEEV